MYSKFLTSLLLALASTCILHNGVQATETGPSHNVVRRFLHDFAHASAELQPRTNPISVDTQADLIDRYGHPGSEEGSFKGRKHRRSVEPSTFINLDADSALTPKPKLKRKLRRRSSGRFSASENSASDGNTTSGARRVKRRGIKVLSRRMLKARQRGNVSDSSLSDTGFSATDGNTTSGVRTRLVSRIIRSRTASTKSLQKRQNNGFTSDSANSLTDGIDSLSDGITSNSDSDRAPRGAAPAAPAAPANGSDRIVRLNRAARAARAQRARGSVGKRQAGGNTSDSANSFTDGITDNSASETDSPRAGASRIVKLGRKTRARNLEKRQNNGNTSDSANSLTDGITSATDGITSATDGIDSNSDSDFGAAPAPRPALPAAAPATGFSRVVKLGRNSRARARNLARRQNNGNTSDSANSLTDGITSATDGIDSNSDSDFGRPSASPRPPRAAAPAAGAGRSDRIVRLGSVAVSRNGQVKRSNRVSFMKSIVDSLRA